MLSDAQLMAEVLAAFQEEQAEHRETIGEILLDLERDPQHSQRRTLLDALFRAAHSLKGSARAAGQDAVEALAHCMEDLFSRLRDGSISLTPAVCDPLYAALDAIGVMMQQVTAGHVPTLDPYQQLLARLAALSQGPDDIPASQLPRDELVVSPIEAIVPPQSVAVSQSSSPSSVASQPLAAVVETAASGADSPTDLGGTSVRISTAILDTLLNESGELITATLRQRQHARDGQALVEVTDHWHRIWRLAQPAMARLRASTATQPTVTYLLDRPEFAAVSVPRAGDQEIEVVLGTLAQANTLIADLEARLSHHARQITEDSSRLEAVTKRLHAQVRRTRMLPLATLFGPLRLQVRDMARTAARTATLELDDGGAEADRQVLERMREVLLHLLRNAIDHGIEAADVRIARGKSPTGLIRLQAAVTGDRLTVTLEDDGGGLDLSAIRQRALASGQYTETELAQMDEAELTDLIFLPGFSTRQTISTLSGRGVGLDVVRSHVERMRGRVNIRSTPGAGCVFTINVPLSLASTHGLLIQAGRATYAVALDSVQQIVAVLPDDIRMVEGRVALVVDGRPFAVAHLADVLGLRTIPSAGTVAPGPARLALLLVNGERQVACLVDAVLGEQEFVVQRLPAPLLRVRFVGGATILADGSVAPMLDVVDLFHAIAGSRAGMSLAPAPATPVRRPTILVADDSITTRTLEKNILEAAGYQVHLAIDGADALQRLGGLVANGGCDLLLSDVDMPHLNGFELTQQVRADARFQHIPIVLVTSLDAPADRERGIAAGADAYLIKRSFDQHALLETIANLI